MKILQVAVALVTFCAIVFAEPPPGTWSEWTKWGPCTGECGVDKGIQYRSRTCQYAAVADELRVASEPAAPHCPDGANSASEKRSCTARKCAVWASWGSWERCTTVRQRTCVIEGTNTPSSKCSGQGKETKFCDDCKGDWSPWGNWGSCVSPTPCGDGTKTRTRTCLPSSYFRCDGPSSNVMKCKHQCNPVWTAWGTWGGCSVTCGSGIRVRSRKCVAQGTNILVSECPGSSTSTLACHLRGCPVWGPYGPWGPCRGPCGGTGSQSRTQICVYAGTTTPATGCKGNAHTQTQACPVLGCPIWASWGNFGPCSATCGLASKTRTRRCVLAGSSTSASGCVGFSSDSQGCITLKCGPPPCVYICSPTDREQKVCANDPVRGKRTFTNECEFKRARKCQYPLITIANFGKCLTVAGGGGGISIGGGGGGGIGGNAL